LATRVLIFGASGGTGTLLVERALSEVYDVTAFVRTPAKLGVRHERLRVFQGDVTDIQAVRAAVDGHDAVLCALGAATPLQRDPTLVQGVGHIVGAMEAADVRRLVYLSFLGVHAGRHQLSRFGRYFVAPVVMRNVVADHEAKEAIIQRSSLDWTIVRPPRLTYGGARGNYRHGLDITANSTVPTVSRADLAAFMVQQLHDPTYIHRAPAVMY
jgi:putative NADH-flavin reductase